MSFGVPKRSSRLTNTDRAHLNGALCRHLRAKMREAGGELTLEELFAAGQKLTDFDLKGGPPITPQAPNWKGACVAPTNKKAPPITYIGYVVATMLLAKVVRWSGSKLALQRPEDLLVFEESPRPPPPPPSQAQLSFVYSGPAKGSLPGQQGLFGGEAPIKKKSTAGA